MTEFLARLNPELLRGWRTEITRVRLAVTLALSIGVAWCIQLAWGWMTMGRVGLLTFGIFSFIVTPIRIVGAIADEHDRHTWQRQRMSALSPTQLMLGKAFGATALTDIAALCALVCWGLGTFAPAESLVIGTHLAEPEEIEQIEEMRQRARDTVRAGFPLNAWLMICANLFARFLALALAIRNCDRSKVARGRSFVVAILLAILLSSPLTVLREALTRGTTQDVETVTRWFGFWPMNGDFFWVASGLLFAILAAFWCWCAARETLSTGRFPAEAVAVGLGMGLWWAGTAYGAGDAAGFVLIEAGYGPWRTATAAMLLALTATAYLWGVAERLDRRKAREFLAASTLLSPVIVCATPTFGMRVQHFLDDPAGLRSVPPWLLIVLLAAITVVAHLVLGLFAGSRELGYIQQNFWAVSLLGFLVRDMGILFLVLSGRAKRWPELAALASWLVLGLFLPGALNGAEAAVGEFELYMLFSPIAFHDTTANLLIGAVSAWLQAGLIMFWLRWRGRREWQA